MYVKYLALLGEACWMRISSPLLATDWSNFFCSASCSSSSWKTNMPNSWTQLFMISFSLQKSSPDFITVCYCELFLLQWKYHYQMHMCFNISKQKKSTKERKQKKGKYTLCLCRLSWCCWDRVVRAWASQSCTLGLWERLESDSLSSCSCREP